MSTTTETIGRILAGRYRIESILGTGASAHVFAAWDVTLRRRVAIKLLHPALATDGAFLRRFRAEAQAAAALTHPHVLAVYDWGEDSSGPFLVLEFLGGGSLREMLDEGRSLSVSQATAVGSQAAEGLAYAHARGFVHRDVKPANLLFDEEGRLRVADFGLARALAEAALTEPQGAAVGTARYAAPEQALGTPVDGRADVYSLALVLYEALTGVVPFSADTTISTLMARVGASLPAHEALGPLGEVLEAAAAPEPAERLDATSLAARLSEIAAGLPAPQPLPLVGAGAGEVRPPEAADRTELGVRTGEDDFDTSQMMAVASAVAECRWFGHPDGVGSPGEEASGASRRSVRAWKAAVVALVVALVLAGAALAAVQTQLFVPSHPVPALAGLSTSQATAKLRPVHFKLKVVGHRHSTTVADAAVVSQVPTAGTHVKEGGTVSVVLSTGPPPVQIPSLTSISSGDCPAVTAALAPAHLHPDCVYQHSTQVPSGGVVDWNPKGTAPEFSVVKVWISQGPPIVSVPSLDGLTCATATSTLQALGLVAKCVDTRTTSGTPVGQVIPNSWTPSGGVPEGSTVTVPISQGPPLVQVPGVGRNETVGQIVSALQALGLAAGQLYGPVGGMVFATNPSNPSQVPQGTTINIYTH